MKTWKSILIMMLIACTLPIGGCLFDSDDDDTTVVTTSTTFTGTNAMTVALTGTGGGLTAANTAPSYAVSTNYTSSQIDIYKDGVKLGVSDKAKFVFNSNKIIMPNINSGVWTFVFFDQAAFSVNVAAGREVVCEAALPGTSLNFDENKDLNVATGDTALGTTVKVFSYQKSSTATTGGTAMDYQQYTTAVLTQATGKVGLTASNLNKIKIFSPDDVTPSTLTKTLYTDASNNALGTSASVLSTILTPSKLNKKTGSKYGLTAAAGDTTLTDWTSTILSTIQGLLSYTTNSSVSISTAANLFTFIKDAADNKLTVKGIYLMSKTDFDAIDSVSKVKNSTIKSTDLTTSNVFYWVVLTESETADYVYLSYDLTRYDGTVSRVSNQKLYKKTYQGTYVDNVYYLSGTLSGLDVKDNKVTISAKVQDGTLIVESTSLTYTITGTITRPGIAAVYVTAQNTSSAPSSGTEEVTSGTKQNNKVYNDVTAGTVDMYLGTKITVTNSDTDETYLYVYLRNKASNNTLYNTDSANGWSSYSNGSRNVDSVVNSTNNGLTGDSRISVVTSGSFKGYYKMKLSDLYNGVAPTSTAVTGTNNKGHYIWTPYGDDKGNTYPGASSTKGLGNNGYAQFYAWASNGDRITSWRHTDTLYYIVAVDFGTNEFYGEVEAKLAIVDKYGVPSSIETKNVRVAYKTSTMYDNSIVPNFTLLYTDSTETAAGGTILKTTYTQQARAGKSLTIIASPTDSSYAKYSGRYALKFYVLVEAVASTGSSRIIDHYFLADWWENGTSSPAKSGAVTRFITENNLYGWPECAAITAGLSYNLRVSAIAPNGTVHTETANIAVSSN